MMEEENEVNQSVQQEQARIKKIKRYKEKNWERLELLELKETKQLVQKFHKKEKDKKKLKNFKKILRENDIYLVLKQNEDVDKIPSGQYSALLRKILTLNDSRLDQLYQTIQGLKKLKEENNAPCDQQYIKVILFFIALIGALVAAWSAGQVWGIVVSVLCGIATLGLIFFCCKKYWKRNEIANEN